MNKKIQIAFFKAKYGSVLSKTIEIVTNSEYSHAEIIIDNYWYGSNINLLGRSGITKIHKPTIKPNEWLIIDIEVSNDEFKMIKELADNCVGADYAFIAAIKSQFQFFEVKTEDVFFCSQFITYLLKKTKILNFNKKEPAKYDPGQLLNELTNKIKYTPGKNKILKFSTLKASTFSMEEILELW